MSVKVGNVDLFDVHTEDEQTNKYEIESRFHVRSLINCIDAIDGEVLAGM
jgi:hypothetical protein